MDFMWQSIQGEVGFCLIMIKEKLNRLLRKFKLFSAALLNI